MGGRRHVGWCILEATARLSRAGVGKGLPDEPGKSVAERAEPVVDPAGYGEGSDEDHPEHGNHEEEIQVLSHTAVRLGVLCALACRAPMADGDAALLRQQAAMPVR